MKNLMNKFSIESLGLGEDTSREVNYADFSIESANEEMTMMSDLNDLNEMAYEATQEHAAINAHNVLYAIASMESQGCDADQTRAIFENKGFTGYALEAAVDVIKRNAYMASAKIKAIIKAIVEWIAKLLTIGGHSKAAFKKVAKTAKKLAEDIAKKRATSKNVDKDSFKANVMISIAGDIEAQMEKEMSSEGITDAFKGISKLPKVLYNTVAGVVVTGTVWTSEKIAGVAEWMKDVADKLMGAKKGDSQDGSGGGTTTEDMSNAANTFTEDTSYAGFKQNIKPLYLLVGFQTPLNEAKTISEHMDSMKEKDDTMFDDMREAFKERDELEKNALLARVTGNLKVLQAILADYGSQTDKIQKGYAKLKKYFSKLSEKNSVEWVKEEGTDKESEMMKADFVIHCSNMIQIMNQLSSGLKRLAAIRMNMSQMILTDGAKILSMM